MQTFLPYPDFQRSLSCLDYRRLGKQRSESLILLRGKWSNHPASKMWVGYHVALRLYINLNIAEWVRRGYRNTMEIAPISETIVYPPWFGDEAFHASHRSALLRKDPEWYGRFGWTEPDDLPYVWPSVGSKA